jgi:hypothetical protein
MHVIRLRGPWHQEPLPGGSVRYSRRFHRPTGLESGDRVFLVLDGSAAAVVLNGQPLALGSGRYDITELLAAKNLLELAAPAGLPTDGLARLEIGQSREPQMKHR